MFLLKRARGLRMFGFGLGGGGGSEKEEPEPIGQPESPPQSTPPWLKRQKVTENDENKENSQNNLVESIRCVFSFK